MEVPKRWARLTYWCFSSTIRKRPGVGSKFTNLQQVVSGETATITKVRQILLCVLTWVFFLLSLNMEMAFRHFLRNWKCPKVISDKWCKNLPLSHTQRLFHVYNKCLRLDLVHEYFNQELKYEFLSISSFLRTKLARQSFQKYG